MKQFFVFFSTLVAKRLPGTQYMGAAALLLPIGQKGWRRKERYHIGGTAHVPKGRTPGNLGSCCLSRGIFTGGKKIIVIILLNQNWRKMSKL